MRDLLNYFIRNSKWFVFAIYFVASLILLIRTNPFAQNVYMTSANAVSGSLYNLADRVGGYMHLKETNEELNERNAKLLAELELLRMQNLALQEAVISDTIILPESLKPYDFKTAHVVKNSVFRPKNFITINKGTKDGIGSEMGVIDANGVVGVVGTAGNNYSRVISLLNPDFRLSCKIKGNDSFGSLIWDGKDARYAVLEELPRHIEYNDGDTIVTSGYSSVFPGGIPVGIIEGQENSANSNMLNVRVRLFTDFTRLQNVQVIVNYISDEIKMLNPEE